MGTDNLNITNVREMISPKELKQQYKSNSEINEHIETSREDISNIIHLKDDRLMVVVGPCSIHNTEEGLEYARKLKNIETKYPNLYIVMRSYFEKPRTTLGWKGLITDPNLDGSFDIESGLKTSREFLLELNKLGLPVATEFLSNIVPAYIANQISWGAIGARTTESQTHREMVSGLSMPIGFKNSTDGSIKVATDAIQASSGAHSFLGSNEDGRVAIINSSGNKDSHIILRGGVKTNYDSVSVSETIDSLYKAGINTGIMIDASHSNSMKKYKNQILVCKDIATQISNGNKKIMGVMIESNINEGNQKLIDKDSLKYGVSITDACINFEDTGLVLDDLNKATSKRNKK